MLDQLNDPTANTGLLHKYGLPISDCFANMAQQARKRVNDCIKVDPLKDPNANTGLLHEYGTTGDCFTPVRSGLLHALLALSIVTDARFNNMIQIVWTI